VQNQERCGEYAILGGGGACTLPPPPPPPPPRWCSNCVIGGGGDDDEFFCFCAAKKLGALQLTTAAFSPPKWSQFVSAFRRLFRRRSSFALEAQVAAALWFVRSALCIYVYIIAVSACAPVCQKTRCFLFVICFTAHIILSCLCVA